MWSVSERISIKGIKKREMHSGTLAYPHCSHTLECYWSFLSSTSRLLVFSGTWQNAMYEQGVYTKWMPTKSGQNMYTYMLCPRPMNVPCTDRVYVLTENHCGKDDMCMFLSSSYYLIILYCIYEGDLHLFRTLANRGRHVVCYVCWYIQ